MHWNILDDGRQVIVDTSQEQTHNVKGEEHFVHPDYVRVWLDGNWQTVKKSRLGTVLSVSYGSPFGVLETTRDPKKRND